MTEQESVTPPLRIGLHIRCRLVRRATTETGKGLCDMTLGRCMPSLPTVLFSSIEAGQACAAPPGCLAPAAA